MQPRTILVVEDDPFIRTDVSHHLMECGFHVLEATRVGEAMGLLSRVPDIDLVFTDVNLPGKADGLDLVKWISERFPHIPVIVTTGDASRSERSGQLAGQTLYLNPMTKAKSRSWCRPCFQRVAPSSVSVSPPPYGETIHLQFEYYRLAAAAAKAAETIHK